LPETSTVNAHANVVSLVLTRGGYDELVALLEEVPSPIWVTSGVLSTSQQRALRDGEIEVISFSDGYGLNGVVAHAVATVRDHHPNHSLWVELTPGAVEEHR
jgi:hypothetical protein